jgi:hypothetical protein
MYVAKPIFCQNEYIACAVKTSSPKFRATSVVFKTLPKVNNRSKCENSPNVVTLRQTNLPQSVVKLLSTQLGEGTELILKSGPARFKSILKKKFH